MPPEEVRPWIDRLWSRSDLDPFPHDLLPGWRRNPGGGDGWRPGETRFSAGRFVFRLDQWDGRTLRATFEGDRLTGWHAFELEPFEGGTLLKHTLHADLGAAGTPPLWSFYLQPLHDWLIEAMFDRIVAAVRTGRVPARTNRPLPLVQGALLRLRRWLRSTHFIWMA